MINGAVSMAVVFIYLIYEFWKKLDYFAFCGFIIPKGVFYKRNINQAINS